jgi:hypothetical protein
LGVCRVRRQQLELLLTPLRTCKSVANYGRCSDYHALSAGQLP